MLLDIEGLGVIMYAPSATAHIAEGEDYLQPHFMDKDDVHAHVVAGTIVAFATSSPGTFILRFRDGYPDPKRDQDAEFKLKVAVRSDGVIIFRDLYDLFEWTAEYPPDQAIAMPAGIYDVTLLADTPESGIIGDDQVIEVYLQPVDEMPTPPHLGVPTLIY